MTSYFCRDCGLKLTPDRPTNKCPNCGSLYLIPDTLKVTHNLKPIRISLSERFLSLILGAIFGLLTFFIWGITFLVKGGPGAGKAAAGAFIIGVKLSLLVALGVGLSGFFLGEKKLVKLLGILWGTDIEFNEELESLLLSIPRWVVYLALIFAIVGAYGYLAMQH